MTVTRLQEKNIIYSPSSALNSDLHPVRPGAKAPVEDEQTEEVVSEETKEKSEESDTKKEEKKPEEDKK